MKTRTLASICLPIAIGATLALAMTPPAYLGGTNVDGHVVTVAHTPAKPVTHANPVVTPRDGYTVTAPDWTVAPCARFAHGAEIPAYTRLDECVADDGAMVAR